LNSPCLRCSGIVDVSDDAAVAKVVGPDNVAADDDYEYLVIST